ncbi:MAG TPA: diacylglycerol kinase family protein [Coriobacteriia bacterium]
MRVLVVHNPKGSRGDAGLYDFIRELAHRDGEVALRPLSAVRTLDRALHDAEDFDRVVVAGGDGTVASAAHLLRGTGVPLLPFASGTGNLISLNLREPSDPVALADVLLAGRLKKVDLGEITYELPAKRVPVERRRLPRPRPKARFGFTGLAGVGADAALMENAQKLKPVFGAGGYLMALLQNPTPAMAAIELDLDGRRVATEGSAVLLVNFARIQFDLSLAHDSDATDGHLEVVVVKARNVTDLLPAVMAAWLDTVVTFPDRTRVFDTYRAKKVRISADPALPLQSDGEIVGAVTPVSARVLPLAGTFVVPKP